MNEVSGKKESEPSRKKTSWSGVAAWYDDLLEGNDDSYQKNVIMPNLIRILGPKAGMSVIDVACGQGYFTRAFAQNGATTVGCDISKDLIELARKNSAGKDPKSAPAEYFVAPADSFASSAGRLAIPTGRQPSTETSFVGRFDAATIILALQNIENLQGVFAECAKALKPDGRLIFVVNHPAFRIPKASAWGWEEKGIGGSVQYRRIDSYMTDSQIKIDMTPGEEIEYKKRYTLSIHRPLQSYVKALNKSGFAVTRLEEWISHKKSEKGPRASEEDRMRKEIPMFLCIEGRKSF